MRIIFFVTLMILSIKISFCQINIYGVDITKAESSNNTWKWDALVGGYVKDISTSTPFDAVYKYPDKDYTFLTYRGDYQNIHLRFKDAFIYLQSKFGNKYESIILGEEITTKYQNDSLSFIRTYYALNESDSTEYYRDLSFKFEGKKIIVVNGDTLKKPTCDSRDKYATRENYGIENSVLLEERERAKKCNQEYEIYSYYMRELEKHNKIEKDSLHKKFQEHNSKPKIYDKKQTDYLDLDEMFKLIFIHSRELTISWEIKDPKNNNRYTIALTWSEKGINIKYFNWSQK